MTNSGWGATWKYKEKKNADASNKRTANMHMHFSFSNCFMSFYVCSLNPLKKTHGSLHDFWLR